MHTLRGQIYRFFFVMEKTFKYKETQTPQRIVCVLILKKRAKYELKHQYNDGQIILHHPETCFWILTVTQHFSFTSAQAESFLKIQLGHWHIANIYCLWTPPVSFILYCRQTIKVMKKKETSIFILFLSLISCSVLLCLSLHFNSWQNDLKCPKKKGKMFVQL